ncbi:MAG: DUF4870 domain-containing protein [Brachymonas sp.]|nr:DUF4870 domain-containing protein [Brachymonas sp.]
MDHQIQENAVSKESRNLAVMGWVGSIFLWFIPGLIIYLIKEHDTYARSQAKEMLNWSITVSIAYFACAILSLVLIGLLGFLIVGICHLVFCIMGAVATSNGKAFKTPCTLRLIK